MTKRLLARVVLAVLLAGYVPLGSMTQPPSALGASCFQQKRWVEHVPQLFADGARMKWPARITHATDWATLGFAAQVLWIGTDNQPDDDVWVEVGLTHGWLGLDAFTFYSAHQTLNGTYQAKRMAAHTPVPGVTYTWSALYSADTYIVTIERPGFWEYATIWADHGLGTTMYSGGFEVTCRESSRVDRTYVSLSQLRRWPNSTWTNVDNGQIFGSPGDGAVVWCTAPRQFRYYIHSNIDPTLCQ